MRCLNSYGADQIWRYLELSLPSAIAKLPFLSVWGSVSVSKGSPIDCVGNNREDTHDRLARRNIENGKVLLLMFFMWQTVILPRLILSLQTSQLYTCSARWIQVPPAPIRVWIIRISWQFKVQWRLHSYLSVLICLFNSKFASFERIVLGITFSNEAGGTCTLAASLSPCTNGFSLLRDWTLASSCVLL